MVTVRAVRCADTVEAVTLHNTSKTLTFARASHVDQLAGFKNLGANFLTERVLISIASAKLNNMAARSYASLREVSSERLGYLTWVDSTEGELNSDITVACFVSHLGDNARTGLYDGNRNHPVVRVEDLSHTELLAQQALDRLCHGYISPIRA
jgi:hypothetical protein